MHSDVRISLGQADLLGRCNPTVFGAGRLHSYERKEQPDVSTAGGVTTVC